MMLKPDDEHRRNATLQRQKAHLEAILKRLDRLDKRFVWVRAASSLLIVCGLSLAFFRQVSWLSLWIAGFFFIAFSLAVYFHRRVDHSREQFRLALSFVSTQQARMSLDWEGIPASPPFPLDPNHPFAGDLQLVGEQSLYQLIDTATSLGGSRRLAGWLLNPLPDFGIIQQRHALLQELIPLSSFRSRLGLRGRLIQEEIQDRWDGERLLQTFKKPIDASLAAFLARLSILSAVNMVLFALFLGGLIPPVWIAGLILYGFIYLARFSAYRDIFADTYTIGRSLEQVKRVFTFLEASSYTSTPGLAKLCEPFNRSAKRPSQFLRKLTWITLASGLGNNPVLGVVLNLVVPWNLFLAYSLNRYIQDLSGPLQEWLQAWYEVEALCSLANFAWLNPAYAFPHLLTNEPGLDHNVFQGRDLGHPLIPAQRRKCNDFSIVNLGDIAILTGSNMAGKSTFLRTIGINLCLVNAGGPVAATEMRTLLFRPFTCIQVSESLSDGISYFYAEVRRLKQLLLELEKADALWVFYLIDEIYRGTNNQERRIGSQALLHTLCQQQGVGVVTTHDLELTQLSRIESHVSNYHFREEILDGRMRYDYCLRSGPSQTTNALKIMEMAGLPVKPPKLETMNKSGSG